MGNPRSDLLMGVVEAAAEALETPVEELPPLYPVVDPEALDALVSSNEHARHSPVTVTFEYAGVEIIIHGPELICARPIGDDQDTPVRTPE